jgi:hypothetical protein
MAAAYAVALQMLLSAVVASQMAAAAPSGGFPICFGVTQPADAAGKGDLVPVHQASCILCTVGLSAPVDFTAPMAQPGLAWTDVARPRPMGDPHVAQAPPSPRLSQGPPRIA